MEHWVPEESTVSQYYYKQVLEKLRKKVQRKRPELWKNGFILHQHTLHKTFLAKKQISTLDHLPYSLDLAPGNFFLFPKIKAVLRGTRFDTVPQVKEKTIELLRHLTKKDLLHSFNQWKISMQQCVDAQEKCIEG